MVVIRGLLGQGMMQTFKVWNMYVANISTFLLRLYYSKDPII